MLKNEKHKIAAYIELEGGARLEACSLIKESQLVGVDYDEITQTLKSVIFTKEKGGKEGYCYIKNKTFVLLEKYIKENKVFKLDRQEYFKDLREVCNKLNIPCEGTHGFRWNFAQNRMYEYACAGYTYEQSLLLVSSEMKHNRASITEHYLG
jgi:integrase